MRAADDVETIEVLPDHPARGRRQWALIAAVALVATVLVAVATARDPQPAAPATQSGVYTTPTRGSLSDDAAFLEGMLRLPWRNQSAGADVPEPPLDTRHVVYAGNVHGARWALLAGADPAALPPDQGVDPADLDALGSVAIAWFTGPSDATADEMRLAGVPRVVGADEPTALSDTVTGASVLVAAPGDRIETSPLVWVEPDGALFREYTLEEAPQGIVVGHGGMPLDGSMDRAGRYRVTRGSTVFSGGPEAYANPDFVPPDVELARLRPAPVPAPGDAAVAAAIDDLLSRTGVFARVLSFTVVWAGDLPTRDGGSARLTLLAAEFSEGGGVYVTGALGHDAGRGDVESTSCGSEIRPGGTSLDEMVFVVRCDSDSGSGDAPPNGVVVVAPPGTATAEALDRDDEVLGRYPLADGVGVLPVTADLASVRFLDAGDAIAGQTAPMGTADFGE